MRAFWNTTSWGLKPCYSTSLLPFLLLPIIHPYNWKTCLSDCLNSFPSNLHSSFSFILGCLWWCLLAGSLHQGHPGLPSVGVSNIKELPGGGWNPLAIHIMSLPAWKACHCTVLRTKWQNLEDTPPRENVPQHSKGSKMLCFTKIVTPMESLDTHELWIWEAWSLESFLNGIIWDDYLMTMELWIIAEAMKDPTLHLS